MYNYVPRACSAREMAVAHSVWIRILSQITIKYELTGSFVVLGGSLGKIDFVSSMRAWLMKFSSKSYRHILENSPPNANTLFSPPISLSY